MENTSSPARSSHKSKKQSGCSPLNFRKQAYTNQKSCFSDDEDKPDNQFDEIKDIMEEAEKNDGPKSSRMDLYECMASMLNAPTSANKSKKKLETSQEIKEAAFEDTQEIASSTGSPNRPQQKDASWNLDKTKKSTSPMSPEDKMKIYQIEEKPIIPSPESDVADLEDIKMTTRASHIEVAPEINFGEASYFDDNYKRLPSFEGFLEKKTTDIFGRWQRRYFVIKNKKLCYYLTELKELKTGIIDFDLVSIKLEKGSKKTEFKIIPLKSSRVFTLRAATEEERDKWFAAIEKNVQASKGALSELTKTAILKEFWKNERISESMFRHQADTGDILLFKSHSFLSKFTRSFTRSEYDHVALIIRYANHQVCLFEAMRVGVGICRWTTFLDKKWPDLYSKVVYRKLVIPRTQELVDEIAKFAKNNLGKKFKLTPQKLLKKKSPAGSAEDNNFFCSELVAACYKKAGLLPPDVSASTYFPGTFSAEKKLQLLNGAKLSQEYLIDFSL